jgi:hypothetical protein
MPPSVRGAEVAAGACGVSGSVRLKVPLAERFAAAPDVAALVPFGPTIRMLRSWAAYGERVMNLDRHIRHTSLHMVNRW